MLVRRHGGLVFLTLADQTGTLQLLATRDELGEEAFADVEHLDRGDWVGAAGTVMATHTGELTLEVDEVTLLSKALRALPDKHRGLADPEARLRQRYLDLIVNPETRRTFDVRSRGDRDRAAGAGRARLHGGRDAGARRACGRRRRAAVRHPPQRARHRHVHADRARAAAQAARGRRLRARVRDRPRVPQRGARHAPQPRVHAARGLPGARRLPRHDGAGRDDLLAGGARRDRQHGDRRRGAGDRPRAAVAARDDGRPRGGARRRADASGDADRGGARDLRPARDPLPGGLGRGAADLRGLRRDRRARADRADVRHGPPARDLPAGPRAPRRRRAGRALRGGRRRPRAGQRLQRAQRPRRPARALRGRGAREGGRRRGGGGRRRGLHPRARVRPAADRRPRDRHRPARDAGGGRAVDPRRDPVPGAAPGGGGRTRTYRRARRAREQPVIEPLPAAPAVRPPRRHLRAAERPRRSAGSPPSPASSSCSRARSATSRGRRRAMPPGWSRARGCSCSPTGCGAGSGGPGSWRWRSPPSPPSARCCAGPIRSPSSPRPRCSSASPGIATRSGRRPIPRRCCRSRASPLTYVVAVLAFGVGTLALGAEHVREPLSLGGSLAGDAGRPGGARRAVHLHGRVRRLLPGGAARARARRPGGAERAGVPRRARRRHDVGRRPRARPRARARPRRRHARLLRPAARQELLLHRRRRRDARLHLPRRPCARGRRPGRAAGRQGACHRRVRRLLPRARMAAGVPRRPRGRPAALRAARAAQPLPRRRGGHRLRPLHAREERARRRCAASRRSATSASSARPTRRRGCATSSSRCASAGAPARPSAASRWSSAAASPARTPTSCSPSPPTTRTGGRSASCGSCRASTRAGRSTSCNTTPMRPTA